MDKVTKKQIKAIPDFDSRIIIRERWYESFLVMVPVSTGEWNGGKVTIVDPPVQPPTGYKFRDIAVGLELNAKPALATYYLEPLK
jgi:hypothetical protein